MLIIFMEGIIYNHKSMLYSFSSQKLIIYFLIVILSSLLIFQLVEVLINTIAIININKFIIICLFLITSIILKII